MSYIISYVGAGGIALPSIIAIIIIAMFFHNFKDNPCQRDVP